MRSTIMFSVAMICEAFGLRTVEYSSAGALLTLLFLLWLLFLDSKEVDIKG